MNTTTRIRLLALAIATAAALSSCLSPAPKPAPTPSPSPQPEEKDLYALVGSGDMAGLRELLKSREFLNQPDERGEYPLHIAAARDDVPIAEFLIAMGATVDSKNREGKTPLKVALDAGQDAVAGALANRGANLYIKDGSGADPLEAAIRRPSALRAVLTRANVNAQDATGRTPLHRAVRAADPEALAVVLALAPQMNLKDAEGKTPLDEAFLRPQFVESARMAETLAQRGAAGTLEEFAWFERCARDGDFEARRFDDGNAPLHEAVSRNQRGFVQFLLEKGADPDAKNAAGNAPLHMAARLGLLDCARLLLSGGADPNPKDLFDNTPLHLDMHKERRADMLKLLIASKADVDARDRNGNAPLHIAVMLSYPREEAALLLDAGAPPDSANADGSTPLHLAVMKDNSALARLLLERKASLFAPNVRKESPLLLAFKKGRAGASVLVTRETVALKDASGNTPLHLAVAQQNDPDVLALVLESGADPNARNDAGDTPLHVAVSRNKRAMGEALIAAGADVFAANAAGELPVTIAMRNADGSADWAFAEAAARAKDGSGNTILHYAARLNLARLAPVLAQRGADLDARNAAGESPLHAAAKVDAADFVKAVLALKAPAVSRDALGNTPLNLAVQWNAPKSAAHLAQGREVLSLRNLAGNAPVHEAALRDSLVFLSLLVERGADPDAPDASGASPLVAALRSSKIEAARYLVQRGRADVSLRDAAGDTALHVTVHARNAQACKLLLDAGSDIHARNAKEETPFLIALAFGAESLPLVIDARTLESRDRDGRTPLFIASSGKQVPDAVARLLSLGADPDRRDMNGDAPLHAALRSSRLDAAKLLARADADLFARNAKAETPLALAMKAGKDALAAVIGERNVNASDYAGNTPLHIAAQAGDADAAAFIVSMGADKKRRNLAGLTPYEEAIKGGHARVAGIVK